MQVAIGSAVRFVSRKTGLTTSGSVLLEWGQGKVLLSAPMFEGIEDRVYEVGDLEVRQGPTAGQLGQNTKILGKLLRTTLGPEPLNAYAADQVEKLVENFRPTRAKTTKASVKRSVVQVA